jgi:hypothetical protein
VSTSAIEQLLYDISIKRDVRKRFKDEPDAMLAVYPLTDDERFLIKAFRVGDLYRRGVNPMLTLGFWMEAEGSRSMSAYLRRMQE